MDAILRVRSLYGAIVDGGRVALAVSLNISNAFNTLPWDYVGRAMEYHGIPPYLRADVRNYFRDRRLSYRDQDRVSRGRMSCGVPQDSVLGPLMWNLAYDHVLRTALPPGCTVVCYADDKLVLAGGVYWGKATATANVAVACAVRSISGMDLRVAPQKTEAVFFHDGYRGDPPLGASIMVDGTRVPIGIQMKYLGLCLDGKWCFKEHFACLARRVDAVATLLFRLLPYLRNPDGRVRRLYARIVHAVTLYGAPVWAGEMMASRRIKALMHFSQKKWPSE